MFALDSLMCQVENDLEDLNPNKKLKSSETSSELDEDSEDTESSSDSDWK